ncbi:hypothetical protein MTsPCn9_29010 [Croceitalea sp. MTPC9]|nr:hypothetical protein MTsPCn6_30500 [Croceitalea sp. MTPC6]GMN17961.1 hypothetical protein MTsPCn9_29010 [Croceitalea sp. MTPC9]
MKKNRDSKFQVKMERWLLGIIIIAITIALLIGILTLFDTTN